MGWGHCQNGQEQHKARQWEPEDGVTQAFHTCHVRATMEALVFQNETGHLDRWAMACHGQKYETVVFFMWRSTETTDVI